MLNLRYVFMANKIVYLQMINESDAMEDNFIANRKFTSCYNINILYVGLAYGV
jgi:hypothetical protein